MQQFNMNSPFTPSLGREIPVVHYPVVAPKFGVRMYGPAPLGGHVMVTELAPPTVPQPNVTSMFRPDVPPPNFQGRQELPSIRAHNVTSRPAPAPSMSFSAGAAIMASSKPPPGFTSIAQLIASTSVSTAGLPQNGQNRNVSIIKEQPLLMTTDSKLNSGDGESNSASRKLLQFETIKSKSPSLSNQDYPSTPTATPLECLSVSSAEATSSVGPQPPDSHNESSSSSHSLSRLNPKVKEFIPRLCTKRPRPCEDAPTEKLISEKEDSQTKSPVASSENSTSDKQQGRSAFTKLSMKSPPVTPSENNTSDKQQGPSSLTKLPVKSSPVASSENNTSDKEQGPSSIAKLSMKSAPVAPSENSNGDKQQGPSSLTKLSKIAPFLFKLPPKPQCLKQYSANPPLKSTKDSETQTDSSDSLVELLDQKLCAACGRERDEQDNKNPASAMVKSVSRDHKIKYVAYQAAMMVRENPDSLARELELRTRLKARLQAMCRQFGSSVTTMSEVEDATICRIATDLLKEEPIFHQQDKQVSFLRNLSAEADVQLEIAYELMGESPEKKTKEEITMPQPSATENSDPTGVLSSSEKHYAISSSTNKMGHGSGLASVNSSRFKMPPGEAGLSDDPNNAFLNGQAGGRVVSATETESDVKTAAKLDPTIKELSEAVRDKLTLGEAGESPPPATLNDPCLDLQQCQEAAQMLKWQQLYLQSMLGSLNLDGKAGTMLPGLSDELSQSVGGQSSAPSVMQSNLTTANLVKHNSLINQEELACTDRTDISSSTDRDVAKSSHPTRPASRLGNLRKLPPLDLRALRKNQVVSSQPPSAQETISSSASYLSAVNSLSNPNNHKRAEIALSDSGSESQLSVSSEAISQASASAILNSRQPNPSTISTISKPRKYLTPLQRKRLKRMEESERAAETQAQTFRLQYLEEETSESSSDFVKETSDTHFTAIEENPNPSKKRASPVLTEFTSFSFGVNAPSYLSSKTSNLQSTSHLNSQKDSNQAFGSGPYSFSAAIPTSFSFPSFCSDNNPEGSLPDSVSSKCLAQPTLPFDVSKYNSMFNNIPLPSAPPVDANASLGPQITTFPFSQYTDSLNTLRSLVKDKRNRINEISSSLSRRGFTTTGTKDKRANISDLSTISASSNGQVVKEPSDFSLRNEQVVNGPSEVSYYYYEEALLGHPTEGIPLSVSRDGPDNEINELSSDYCKKTGQAANTVETSDEDNYSPASSLKDLALHNLDDLESIDNDDDSVNEYKNKIDDLDKDSNDNIPIIDWYSFDIKSTATKPNTMKSKENHKPCSSSAEQPSPTASSSNVNEPMDLDLLVKEKLRRVKSGAYKGDCGLDEISLSDSQKKLAPAASDREQQEKTGNKQVIVDDGWQTVGHPKKSSKKSKVQADVSILKFRTQEKYTNLVNLILEEYKVLHREEAQEVLETVFTSTNQLAGLRQKQILAEVDLVVTEWYPERVKTETVKDEGDADNGTNSDSE